jgi:hypothetical protein
MHPLEFFDLGFRRPAQGGNATAPIENQIDHYGAVPPSSDKDEPEVITTPTQLFEPNWKTTLGLYAAVVMGIVGKRMLDQIASTGSFRLSPNTLVVSLILAAVGFAQIFRDKITRLDNAALRLFVAFESGFFIDSVVRAAAAAITKAG